MLSLILHLAGGMASLLFYRITTDNSWWIPCVHQKIWNWLSSIHGIGMKVNNSMTTKIYNVISGPIHTDFYPDWSEEEGWVLLVLTEDKFGALINEEVVVDTFAEALEIVDWFKGQIAPYHIELED